MLRLLLYLAERPGEVVSLEELLDQVWAGVVVTQDSVYQAVASLRRLLRDDAKRPAYIVTVPRLGYRLVAPVSSWDDPAPAIAPRADAAGSADGTARAPSARRNTATWLSAGAMLCLVAIGAFVLQSKVVGDHTGPLGNAPRRSIAVLPVLDLTTQEMNEEYFADGMTEELIDRLSKVPGLSVPPPTSSFYFKGKKATVADIARTLGVSYVLDGSIRKSDETLRISARLVRANDGYVVWSDTYNRPASDRLKVQDDIANEVTRALRTAIN